MLHDVLPSIIFFELLVPATILHVVFYDAMIKVT